MTEDQHAFLRSRHSVRRFLETPIPEGVLDRILVTAAAAPSAHNRQPWRTVVVQSTAGKQALAGKMGAVFRKDLLAGGLDPAAAEAQVERSWARITQAPLAVLLCLDKSVLDSYPDRKRRRAEYLMGVQSLALFGGSLLLAAHAEGLGAVWMCAPLFAPAAARKSLSLPAGWEPQGLLLLGYPGQPSTERGRKAPAEFTVYR